MIRELFEDILEHYLEDKQIYAALADKKLSSLFTFTKLEKELPAKFKEVSSLSDHYLFEGSIGKGNMAEVPHLCIFDTAITTSAQTGYYIVYLFEANMSRIYLTLEQAWTQYESKYGRINAKTEIAINTDKIRNIIRSADGFSFKRPVLNATRTLAKGYELGAICSKVYDARNLPTETELIDDLRNLVGVYKELKGLVGTNILEIDTRSKEEIFQDEIQNIVAETPPIGPIPKGYKRVNTGESWKRNGGIAAQALANAGHKCEYQSHHETFISVRSGNHFVEAHHLIPMQFQDNFKYSLDVPENIIALCPNCHRAIHYANGDVKKEMLRVFLQERREGLNKRGIKIMEDLLVEMYMKNKEFVE
ncbi:MrcB family domain-containing protein [Chitinophaga sp.]|uniref:MrcB family domain-containing protein n=1 Tax=Chitinophaga sp. TaxID=1869181 RepID=UPI002F94FEB0